MTLNGTTTLILRFFPPNSMALQADYTTVVENRPIMSVKYSLPIPFFHFWPQLTHPAAWSLCDSWATCLLRSHMLWLYINPAVVTLYRHKYFDNDDISMFDWIWNVLTASFLI